MTTVDWRASVSLVGTVLALLTIPLLATASVAAVYREPLRPFLGPAVLTLLFGLLLGRAHGGDLGSREAFLMVALTWLGVALIGALPFVLAGDGDLAHPLNALFESMSGVTTTGATVITTFDAHGRAILLWRSVLQWLGGLGILVLAVAILSELSVGGAQLMETETQTRNVNKLTPHIRQTALLIGGIYVLLTGTMVVFLLLLNLAGVAPKMGPYNAVAHAFTAVSTAGFSPKADSVGAFSAAVQWAVLPFMFLGATNFVLLYHLGQGDLSRLRQSQEFRFYVTVLAGLTSLVAVLLTVDGTVDGLEPTLRHAAFQVVSIVTTTGYATVDFDLWGAGARHLLFMGMFVGGMAGSTTCSIKTLRWLVVFKAFRRDLFTEIHPDAVKPVRLSGSVVDEDAVSDIQAYVLVSILFVALATMFLVTDAARVGVGVGEFDALGAAASTFLNIGPAFGLAGPYGNYESFPATSKFVMVLLMWVGRIEIFPVLVLLTPAFWRP